MTVTISGGRSPVTITGSRTGATITEPSAGGGVTDHGALTGLSDDDHTQYLNNARGDARYDAIGAAAAAQAASQPLDSDLTAIAALSTTSYGRALLALADAGAARAALGLGTAATAASGDFATAGHNHTGTYDPAGTAASAVSTHAGATDPHGDRAYAAGLISALSYVPLSIMFVQHGPPTANSGTFTATIATAPLIMPYLSGPNTQGAYFEYGGLVALVAGATYTVTMYGNENTDKGITTLTVGADTVGTADWYAASGAAAWRTVTTSYQPSSSSLVAVRCTQATKNASASGYSTRVATLRFVRTA